MSDLQSNFNVTDNVINENLLICGVCGKKLKTKDGLKRHIYVHSGEKTFECTVCLKKFSQKVTLTIHLRSHTGEKPYVCGVCQKGFSQKSDLQIHLRTHTGEKPYACNFCPKTFISRSPLIIHMRNHTNEKPFICDICQKGFRNKYEFNCHLLMHTGVKNFPCNMCSKQFCSRMHLSDHVRRMHEKCSVKTTRKRPPKVQARNMPLRKICPALPKNVQARNMPFHKICPALLNITSNAPASFNEIQSSTISPLPHLMTFENNERQCHQAEYLEKTTSQLSNTLPVSQTSVPSLTSPVLLLLTQPLPQYQVIFSNG